MPLLVFRSTITPCLVLLAPALLFLLTLTVLRSAPTAKTNSFGVPPAPGVESSSSQPVLEESLRSAIEASRYRVRLDQRTDATRENYLASNPAQHFQTLFTTGETIVRPLSRSDSEPSKWTLRLRLKSVGYGKRFTTVEPGEIAAKDNRVQIIHGLSLTPFPVEEWYVNTSKGIEHGFHLPNRLTGKRAGETLRLKLELSGDLKPRLKDKGQAVVLGMSDSKPVLRYEQLHAFDSLGKKLPSHMELAGAELSLVVDDSAAIYPLTIDPYLFEIKKLTAGDGAGGDKFGQSVAIGGDTAVIGSPWDDAGANTNQGSVYVFSRNQGGANSWGEVKKLLAGDGAEESHFGWSVAISGDTLVVGAFTDSNGPEGLGSVYIFERNQGGANNWGQVKKLKAGVVAGSFGWSVAISENSNTIVVGAPAGVTGNELGEAYVFDRNQGGANNWGQVKKLLPGDSSQFDYFAQSVSISGDTIVAGAPGADVGANPDQGAAYVFDRSLGGANNWGLVRKQTSADGAVNDQFGISVSISGDTVVAGAYLDDVGAEPDQGSVYIFERNLGGASNWGQLKKLTASDGGRTDFLGFSVALSGDRIAIGMNTNKAAVVGAGSSMSNGASRAAAYLFDRNQGGANNWGEFQRLRPLDQQINDYFSWSVAISGGTVVGGALLADIASNSDQGAAYIFDSVAGPNPAIKGGSVTVVQGGSAVVRAIATVSDDVTPPGNLVVSVVSSPPGITVDTNFSNRDGVIYTGLVHADCSVAVGSHLVGLQVTDGDGFTATANLTVNVTANDAPTLGDYPTNTVGLGSSGDIFPNAPPGDSGGLPTINVTASAPGFTGSFSVTKTTGMVTFTNAGPAGNHTVTVTATDTCGLFVSRTFTLTVLSQANMLTVNTTADTTANDGFCSLREAISSANTHSASGASAGECVAGVTGTDLIAFNIPGAGPHTIAPASALPTFTEPIILDGLSQPGAACNAWPPTLKIVLNGANAGAASGLTLATFNSTVRGLVVNQFTNFGIVSSGNGNTFQCNFLGTNVTGTTRVANGTGISFGGTGNLIGGATPGARNLISGNGDGIFTGSNSLGTTNLVQGNFIGTDVTGTLDLGNTLNGVHVNGGGFLGGSNLQIGGTTPEARNIISGNDRNGVLIENSDTFNRPTRVIGNYIGTDVTGAARLGNGLDGVLIANSSLTQVGFTSAGSGNVISANFGAGVTIRGAAVSGNFLQGNYIGTDATGKLALGNDFNGVWIDNSGSNHVGITVGNTIAFNASDGVRIQGSASTKNNIVLNSIFSNTGLGINLGSDGVTPNDLGDADIGPNNLQNFPVITSVITNGVTTRVQGTLNSKPNFEYTIQFFLADGCDSSGNGEGKTWIADHVVKTDGAGAATIDTSLPVTVSPGQVITATAILSDAAAASADRDGTSEFSSCRVAQGIGPDPGPATAFTVNSPNDPGDGICNPAECTLREAITTANAHTGADIIAFNIPGTGPHTISPTSPLPGITEQVTIDGLTQPGASCAAWPPALRIVLSGNNAGASASGLTITRTAESSIVRGLVINQFGGSGIFLPSANPSDNAATENTLVQCNFIGTDVTGTTALGNGVGVLVESSVDGGNLVGGSTNTARNLISGNTTGILISRSRGGSSTRVEGNFIGTDVSGTIDLGNTSFGVAEGGAPAKSFGLIVIGGTAPGTRNIISGNDQGGIGVGSAHVLGNFIGVDLAGKARLGNGGSGVRVLGAAAIIGNVISANTGAGVSTEIASVGSGIAGNYIGTDLSGTLDLGNGLDGILLGDFLGLHLIGKHFDTPEPIQPNVIAFNQRDGIRVEGSTHNLFSYNSIFNNAGLGINLGSDGVTANDTGDSDTGPNNLQNFPQLTSAVNNGTTTTIQGTLNSRPDRGYTLQFFSNAACDPSGNGEGQVWLADLVVNTDGSGNATINAAIPVAVSPGQLITATATLTNPGSDADWNGTSEFSPCQSVVGATPTPTPTPSPTPSPSPSPTPNQVQFSVPNFASQEDCTFVTITVARTGDTSGAASVDYATSNITATERGDYITALGRLHFAPAEISKTFVVLINEDSYVEGEETFRVNLTNPTGVGLGAPSIATVAITDDVSEPATNMIDDSRNYVCQHYHDFLNRQPDSGGWDFWTDQITSCGTNAQCIEEKRINVSASFFLSIEFQQTGYLVERTFRTGFGDATGNSTAGGAHTLPVPIIRFREFLSDTQLITKGVVVLQPGWEQQLENNKQAFFAEFVQRSLFTTALPTPMTPAEFVDKLNQNAGNVLSASERTTAINLFGGEANTTNATARAQAVRQVAEDQDLQTVEFNRAFVLMQYIGYLRRNPNDPQDTDHSGYDFWLTKLNQFGGNYINAEMVKAFITSIEYRQRFGP